MKMGNFQTRLLCKNKEKWFVIDSKAPLKNLQIWLNLMMMRQKDI